MIFLKHLSVCEEVYNLHISNEKLNPNPENTYEDMNVTKKKGYMRTGNLLVKQFCTRQSMGCAAAFEVVTAIRKMLYDKSEINIVFAAAPSQNEFLTELAKDTVIDWNRINAFHMDEYIDLSHEAPQRFGNFLYNKLFSKLAFHAVYYIDGNASDSKKECNRYANLLNENPIDIVCMGIGENGHIAFNEPHVAKFNDPLLVKKIELDFRSRQQQVNDGCFKALTDVPTHAITLTIPALMSGSRMFCIVPAHSKAEAVFNVVYGHVSETCPASIIKTHPNAVLYLDCESGKKVFFSNDNKKEMNDITK